MTRPLAIALAASTALSPLAASAADVTLRLPWLLNVQAAGYVMALEKGFYEAVGLNVEVMPGGPGMSSTALVASDANTFGTNDVNGIIMGANQGMDLVMVAACFQRHPAGVITLADSGIREPADLVGRTLAYSEGGPWTLTRAMLARAGVDLADIDLVVSPSTELLINGNVDAKTGFTVNEPIAVELAGLPTHLIVPADWGIQTYAEVIFTTRSFMEENPEVVRDFVAASIRGYEYAYDNPEETVEVVTRINNQLDPEQQAEQLRRQVDYVFTADTEAEGLCTLDPAVIADTMDILVEFADLETDLDVSTLYSLDFLPAE